MIKPANINPQEMKATNKAKCPDCDAELDVPVRHRKRRNLMLPWMRT